MSHKYTRILHPFLFVDQEDLSVPSQAILYGLDEQTVLKRPLQIHPSENDNDGTFVQTSTRSFNAAAQESKFYNTLRRHPAHRNFLLCGYIHSSGSTILERIIPLAKRLFTATDSQRRSWVIQLLQAVRHMEQLGWAHNDISLRNFGVGQYDTLKLFDFGSAVSRDDDPDGFKEDLAMDHEDLASSIYAILVATSQAEADAILHHSHELLMERMHGKYEFKTEAKSVEALLRASWERRDAELTYQDMLEQYRARLGQIEDDTEIDAVSPQRQEQFREHCERLVKDLKLDERWMSRDAYLKKFGGAEAQYGVPVVKT